MELLGSDQQMMTTSTLRSIDCPQLPTSFKLPTITIKNDGWIVTLCTLFLLSCSIITALLK